MKHPHADLLKALAENDLECVEWRVVERNKNPNYIWVYASETFPTFQLESGWAYEFRIVKPKPRRGRWVYDMPVPMHATEPLKVGQEYFLFSPAAQAGYILLTWVDDESDHRWLQAGLIYLTEDDVKKRVESFRAGRWVPVENLSESGAESVVKDAERYRWLRNQFVTKGVVPPLVYALTKDNRSMDKECDSLIDAAMHQGSKP